MIRILTLIVVCALAALPSQSLAAEGEDVFAQYEGQPLNKISFVTWINLGYETLLTTTGLRLGQAFSSEALAQAIEGLRARDTFAVIRPEIESLDRGIYLRFYLEPHRVVTGLDVVGEKTLDEREIRRLARIRTGTRFADIDFESAELRILNGYRKAGHYQASLRYKTKKKSIPTWLDLTYEIEEGYLSKIDRVRLEGEIPDEVSNVRERVQENVGDLPASQDNIERLRREILLALRREGYLQASVELLEDTYQKLSGNVDLVYRISVRDPVSIYFNGNKKFSPDELLAPLKLESRTVPFTPNAMINLAREIERLYQQHGYYRATAQPVKLGKFGSRQLFRIIIDEGEAFRISDVRIFGNSAFSVDKIKSEIRTQEAGAWFFRRWKPGYLLYDQLTADIEHIKSLYSSAGYFDVAVEYSIEVDEDDATLEVHFQINEGPQRLINEVDIQWRGVIDEAENRENVSIDIPSKLLLIQPNLRQGDAFNREELRREQRRLYEEIVQLGYPKASVELQGDANSGSVRYLVTPGARVRVGRIFQQGNILTRDYVLRRELTFSSGEDWNIREIENSKQQLASLGYFRSVSVEPLDGAIDEPVEDVAVRVSERDTGRLEIGGGFTSEDGINIFSELGQRNVRGRGTRLLFGLDGYYKSGGERVFDAGRARLAYTVPRIFGTTSEFTSEIFAQSSVLLVDQFSYDRLGTWFSVSNTLTEKLKGFIGAKAFLESLFDVERDVIIGPDDTGRTAYTFLHTRLDLDHRDNSFNPRKGFRSILDAQISTEALGSQVDLYQLGFEQSLLFELDERLVWANRAQLQFVEPFGDTDVVPISHRVFLGGRNSLRGFSKNSIGPRGKELDIVGGDRGFNLTTELRYDVAEQIVGIVFLDTGQAFLRNKGRFRGDGLDFSNLRFSPGFGVHYRTPIGPIRAEYGVALDREFGERFGRINVSIGTAF